MSKKQIDNLKNECTIEISEANLEDHGTWICQATENPFAKSKNHVETSIEVFVASPYELQMLPRPKNVMSLINETLIEEVICETKGSSLVRPIIEWIANGTLIDPNKFSITEWVVSLFLN